MKDLTVAFKVVCERSCPYYNIEDLFLLTNQAIQMPSGHPSCLILVREVTDLLFNTIVPAAETELEGLKTNTYTCGGCTGLIKFRIDDEIPPIEHEEETSPQIEEKVEKESSSEPPRQRGKTEGVTVSGQLKDISTSELMQFFHMHQKTGKLIIDAPNGIGRVAFREGAIIGAKYMDFEDKDAVFALLRESKGKFSFVNGIPPSLLEVDDIGDFMMLLMEGIKRMDEDNG